MAFDRIQPRVLTRAINRALERGSTSGGGGSGASASQPVVYQQIAFPGITRGTGGVGVTGVQTFNMPSAFQGGKDVVVPLAWFNANSSAPTAVAVNGVSATRWGQGAAPGTSSLELWVAKNVPAAGNQQISITCGASGTTFFVSGGIECSPLAGVAVDITTNSTGTSGIPNVLSAADTQFAELIIGMWRDNAGLSTANTVTAPLIGVFSQGDGNNSLGAGCGYRLSSRMEAQLAAFTCSPNTTYFASVFCLKFALPVTFVGYALQLWGGSDVWVPATIPFTGAGTGVLVSLFGGWNSNMVNGVAGPVPTDSAGTFVGYVNPLGVAGGTGQLQLNVQICDQFNPAGGAHTLTPQPLQVDGDANIAFVHIAGVTQRRCSGYTRQYHAPFGAVGTPDPSTIQNCSVTTTGNPPQVGDTYVAVFAMDPNSDTTHNPNADVQWTSPSGAVVIAQRYDVRDITGLMVVAGVVTVAGHITLNPTDIDPCTFWMDGASAVYSP